MFERCDTCHTDWKFVFKVETFNSDLDFIAGRLGLPPILDPDLHLNQQHSSEEQAEKVTKELILGKLNKGLIERLYQKYRVDFELFGYNAEDYLRT